MKRVLFIINTLNVGGAERQVINDANLLGRSGFDVTIAFHQNGDLSTLLEKSIRLVDLGRKNEFRAIWVLSKFLAENKFDVIFAHMYWALKVSGIPSFLTGHRLFFFEHGLGLWRKFYHLLLVRLNEAFVEKVVVVSSKKRAVKVEREKTPERKVVILPNSFQENETQSGTEAPPLLDEQMVNILFMGRFNPVKQLHLLPGICRRMVEQGARGFNFVICGSGVEEERLQRLICEEGVQEYFQLPGYVKNPFSFLNRSDIFILPSRVEDFSVALLEAGYARLPAVAFDVGGNGEIIRDGQTGFLVPPYETDRFAEALRQLVEAPSLRRRMGAAAHQYIENNFTEEHRRERLLRLIG